MYEDKCSKDECKEGKSEEKSSEKKFILGSNDKVYYGPDKGFFASVFCCYNNHWILKDWWISISQIVARAIDKNANNEKVRKFFVSHEGQTTVIVDGSIYDLDYDWFFKEMKDQISRN